MLALQSKNTLLRITNKRPLLLLREGIDLVNTNGGRFVARFVKLVLHNHVVGRSHAIVDSHAVVELGGVGRKHIFFLVNVAERELQHESVDS